MKRHSTSIANSDIKDAGGFVVDIPGYKQPMEMIMIKAI